MAKLMAFLREWQKMVAQQTATVGAIQLTQDKLIDVNREQLQTGRDANGNEIQPSYKFYPIGNGETYPQYKNKRNPRPGFGIPDLYDTGSFYNSIKFFIQGNDISFTATDEKTPDLLKKYGSVLGVYENTPLQEYRQKYLLPLVVQIIKASTGAK